MRGGARRGGERWNKARGFGRVSERVREASEATVEAAPSFEGAAPSYQLFSFLSLIVKLPAGALAEGIAVARKDVAMLPVEPASTL